MKSSRATAPASFMRTGAAFIAVIGFAALVSGCSSLGGERRYPTEVPGTDRADPFGRRSDETEPGLFGSGGINILGGGGKAEGEGIGVNSYLWRASLDTLSFMPLASADPFGGVIITEWYQPPETPGERFKVTIYILDKRLRADGVRVSVFRQARSAKGEWTDAANDPSTPAKLENAILTRARQLRLANVEG